MLTHPQTSALDATVSSLLHPLGSHPSFYLASAGERTDAGHQPAQATALKNELVLLVKNGETAPASREGREVQGDSGICLNELEGRGQKWDCGSEPYLGLRTPISPALSWSLSCIAAGHILWWEGWDLPTPGASSTRAAIGKKNHRLSYHISFWEAIPSISGWF